MRDILPSGWREATLDDVCQLVRGITFPTNEKRYEPSPGLIACLRTANVQSNIDWKDLWFVPESYVKNEEQYVRENDVLISTANSYELVGKVSRVGKMRCPSTLGAFISLLRAEKGIDAAFLFYQMAAEHTQSTIREMSSTTTNISNVSGGKLKTLKLRIAPEKEQVRIVEKIEELLTDLNVGITELKAAQKKIIKYRQSLLKAAIDGTLTAKWRAQHNHQRDSSETGTQLLERILAKRYARWEAKLLSSYKEQGKVPPKDWKYKYIEPIQPETNGLPKLPAEWVWASAEQLCEFITKGTTPPKGMGDDEDKTVPFLRVTNLTDTGELNFSDQIFVSQQTHRGFLARSVVRPGDVLMNIVGPPLGQVSVVPATFSEWNINQAIAIFRGVDGVLPRFICNYLLSPIAQQWLKARAKTTAGQSNLTLEVCRSLPVPLPALAEQKEIVNELEDALKLIADQEAATSLGLKQVVAQRKNILKAAFSGQLVPQFPNDEPASILLERIRSEREEKQQLPAVRKRKVQQKATAMAKTMNEILDESGDSLPVTEG